MPKVVRGEFEIGEIMRRELERLHKKRSGGNGPVPVINRAEDEEGDINSRLEPEPGRFHGTINNRAKQKG